MNDFLFWFSMGFEHIADFDALDHILFIIALTAIYESKQWKSILILVTAFTVGHSITLALSTLDIIRVNTAITEFLIPVTIALTAIYNIFQSKKDLIKPTKINYSIALFFGLIHGLGFSNVLRAMIGKGESVIYPLFSFNIGIELGQVLIIVILFLISLALITFLKIKAKYWAISISILVLIPSVIISINRWIDLLNL